MGESTVESLAAAVSYLGERSSCAADPGVSLDKEAKEPGDDFLTRKEVDAGVRFLEA